MTMRLRLEESWTSAHDSHAASRRFQVCLGACVLVGLLVYFIYG